MMAAGNGTLNKTAGIDYKQLSMLAKINENHSGEVSSFIKPNHNSYPTMSQSLYGNTDVSALSLSLSLPGSYGRAAGRAQRLWSRCFMCGTGLLERAVTLMRSILN